MTRPFTRPWNTVLRIVRRPRDDHSGAITPFVLIVTIGLFILAGLVIDGGRQLNSKSRAMAYAQESARAGAQALDLTSDVALLNPQDAQAAADQFCQQAMSEDDDLVSCDASWRQDEDQNGARVFTVIVDTTVETDGIMSGMFGVNTWSADGKAAARPVQGITEPETGQQLTMEPPSLETPTGNPFPTDGPSTPPPTQRPSCPSPYDDPYHPRQTWEPGDKPPKPPPTSPGPDDEVPCWPPWEPPKKDKDDDKTPPSQDPSDDGNGQGNDDDGRGNGDNRHGDNRGDRRDNRGQRR